MSLSIFISNRSTLGSWKCFLRDKNSINTIDLSLKSLSPKKEIQDDYRGFRILKTLHENLLLGEGGRSSSLVFLLKIKLTLVVFKVWDKGGLNYWGCSFVKLFGSRVLLEFLKPPTKTHFMDVIEIASHKLGEITTYHFKLYSLITLCTIKWKCQKPPLPNQLKTKPLSLSLSLSLMRSSPLPKSKSFNLKFPNQNHLRLYYYFTTATPQSPPSLHYCSTINPPPLELMFCNSSILWAIDISARRANWCHKRFCHMKTKVVFGFSLILCIIQTLYIKRMKLLRDF